MIKILTLLHYETQNHISKRKLPLRFFFFQEKHNMCPLKNILKEAVRAENECPQLGSSPPSHRAASAHKCPNPVVQYMRSLTKAGSIVSLRQTDTHTHTHTHTGTDTQVLCYSK